jgi:hypothetical protein
VKVPAYFGTSYNNASWGTIVRAKITEGPQGGTSLSIESKTRLRFTLVEGRTKKDVATLHEAVAKFLAG